jgi:hypothetical protein
MKMSVRHMWGATRVRGGRVLIVTHEHQVSTRGYDARNDDLNIHNVHNEEKIRQIAGALPFKARQFDAKWTSAKVGDLAVEVVVAKTGCILGYAYISGASINVIRYVNDADRSSVAGWFSTGKGLRFDPVGAESAEQFLASIMAIKYSGADVAVTTVKVSSEAEQDAASQALLEMFAYVDDSREATTDILAKVSRRGGLLRKKDYALLHLQIEKRGQEYAVQPFVFELLESSPELVHHEFLVPMAETPLTVPLASSTT